jgi:hypothetical protein
LQYSRQECLEGAVILSQISKSHTELILNIRMFSCCQSGGCSDVLVNFVMCGSLAAEASRNYLFDAPEEEKAAKLQ